MLDRCDYGYDRKKFLCFAITQSIERNALVFFSSSSRLPSFLVNFSFYTICKFDEYQIISCHVMEMETISGNNV